MSDETVFSIQIDGAGISIDKEVSADVARRIINILLSEDAVKEMDRKNDIINNKGVLKNE